MKVVFFSSTGRMVGGAVMCLKEILLYCKNQGIESFVILRSHGDFEGFLDEIGIRHEVVSYHDWLRPKKDHGGVKNEIKWRIKDFQNVFAEKQAYRILKREKPDIYHLNVIYNPCGAVSAHKLGIPVVWHLREFAEIDEVTPFFRNRGKSYELIAKSEKIICVSDCLKEYYSKYIQSPNMVRIYDGIKIPDNKIIRKEKPKVFNITLSGGARVKGHEDLLRAAATLQEHGIANFCITIAGRFADEHYLSELKEQVKNLGLCEKVHFIGFQANMNILWEKTDIAVVCSRFESFGLSICEAMARGIPAVCAKSTGTYEVTDYGEYAWVYEVGNYEQLAMLLKRTMYEYEKCMKKAACVAEKVKRKYSIERSCNKLFTVFTELKGSIKESE